MTSDDEINRLEIDLLDKVDYWEVCRAIGLSLDSSTSEYWDLIARLKDVYPQFDWLNAISDYETFR